MTSIAIVVFLYVIIAIVLVNTLSIEFIFSSAPTVCDCGWSPSRLFPQMGNITSSLTTFFNLSSFLLLLPFQYLPSVWVYMGSKN